MSAIGLRVWASVGASLLSRWGRGKMVPHGLERRFNLTTIKKKHGFLKISRARLVCSDARMVAVLFSRSPLIWGKTLGTTSRWDAGCTHWNCTWGRIPNCRSVGAGPASSAPGPSVAGNARRGRLAIRSSVENWRCYRRFLVRISLIQCELGLVNSVAWSRLWGRLR